jgi:4-diphosphocytidyl-2-C-methyl-D-erythritol kinase
MSTTYRSFAKINLHLEIKGRRSDGYHDLETVFQTVDLSDRVTIEVTEGGGVDLSVSEGRAPSDETNLAHRAAVAFLRSWAPGSGVQLDLRKRIPIGGGLGGGSSNAATVLMGLQEILGVPKSRQGLVDVASGLGADVPYFLWGGTALGRGRGDEIEPLSELAERTLWLITPPIEISTAEVFGGLRIRNSASGREVLGRPWLDSLDWQNLAEGRNDLEEPVLTGFPMMRDVYNVLVEAGATMVRLSGTGATWFALFENASATDELATRLPIGSRVVQTRTLTRSSLDRLRVVR